MCVSLSVLTAKPVKAFKIQYKNNNNNKNNYKIR